jgi:long-chain acyl-CoA synthetase
VIKGDPSPGPLVEAIARHGVTHTVLVPASIQAVLDVVDSTGCDVSTLRVIGYGAAPITPTLLARTIDTLSCKLWQGYGLTETGGPITMLGPDDHPRHGLHPARLRSCGVVMEGCEVRIVDPVSGADVERGGIGEVWIRGPYLMEGYWNQPEETARVMLEDGWLRTGDAAYFDDDGYLYLHDRIKDMIVSGGENVYPGEVENALAEHPGVADVAVIGIPSNRWGETPLAVVVPRAGFELTADDVIAFCRERLAGYKCPTRVEFVAVLPRNPTGKVLKSELRAPYWAGRERFVG